jgi:hypothetical protein
MRGVTASVRGVVVLGMALLSFKESTPGAYGLGASNAALPISTLIGTFPYQSVARSFMPLPSPFGNYVGVSSHSRAVGVDRADHLSQHGAVQ